jgi:glycosyltransferase involved in cell wall biosynthesis
MVGYVGPLWPGRGVIHLLEAFEKVHEQHPQVRLLIAGEGIPDGKGLRALRKRLKTARCAPSVELRTQVTPEEKDEILPRLSVYCLPAVTAEAFGLHLLESLARGVPVVATNIGAFGEILGKTGGGELVPAGDEDALARQINAVLEDQDAADERARMAAEVVREQYADEAVAAQLLATIEEIVRHEEVGEEVAR